jgi:26S proteasome regulatory subunit N1
MVYAEEGNSWVYKNKDHGTEPARPFADSFPYTIFRDDERRCQSRTDFAVDTDVGLSHVDKYSYSAEEYIKVRSQLFIHAQTHSRTQGWRPSRYRSSQHDRSHRS